MGAQIKAAAGAACDLHVAQRPSPGVNLRSLAFPRSDAVLAGLW